MDRLRRAADVGPGDLDRRDRIGFSPEDMYVSADCGNWCDGGGDVSVPWVRVQPGETATYPFYIYYEPWSPITNSVSLTVTPQLNGITQGASDIAYATLNLSTMTATAVNPIPTIAVTPANGTTFTAGPIAQLQVAWCDGDDALVQHSLTWQGQALPDVYTAASTPGCFAAGTSTYTNLVITPGPQNLVATAVDAAGHSVTSTTTITLTPPISAFAPHVTPSAGTHSLSGSNPVSSSDLFTVTNTGSYAAAYALSPACDASTTLSNCSLSKWSMSLNPGASDHGENVVHALGAVRYAGHTRALGALHLIDRGHNRRHGA